MRKPPDASDRATARLRRRSFAHVPIAVEEGVLEMIMRTWRGAVRPEHAERYLDHQARTGIRDYRRTPGNLGALVLRRSVPGLVEVTTVSFWTSMEAVKTFAGDAPEQARFYPGDDELLAEKDLHADHFEVVSWDLDLAQEEL
jgi:heme-degrading monooxygenase HmoA